MTEKTLKSKKMELASYENNYKNSQEIKFENDKRQTLNKLMSENSISGFIDNIKENYPEYNFVVNSKDKKNQSISIEKKNNSNYKEIKINIFENKPSSITLPETVSFNPEKYNMTLSTLQNSLEIAKNISDALEESLEQQIPHIEIENIFEKKNEGFDFRKVLDQIKIEDKNRAYQGHIYSSLNNNETVVITRFSQYKVYGKSVDFTNKQIGTEKELHHPFVHYLGDTGYHNGDIYSHNDFNKSYIKEIPTEDWIKENVPQFSKSITFEDFCEEFKYRVNFLNNNIFNNYNSIVHHYGINNERKSYLNNDEESKKAFGLLAKYVLSEYDNKDDFKFILAENGINSDEDFMNLLSKLSEDSVKIGIEKTASELILETGKNTELKTEKTKTFDLTSIEKELNQMVVTGNCGELQYPGTVEKAKNILNQLKTNGYYPDFEFLNSENRSNSEKALYNFFSSRNGILLEKEERAGYFTSNTYVSTALFSNEGIIKHIGTFPSHLLLEKETFKKERLFENINAVLTADSRLKEPVFNGDLVKIYSVIRENMSKTDKELLDKEYDVSNPKALEQKLKSNLSKLSPKKEKDIDDTRER